MYSIVPVRTGRWGKHAGRALDLLAQGAVVELIGDDRVLGYIIPPRMPLSTEVIDGLIARVPKDQAERRRMELEEMAATGLWHYDPRQDRLVGMPPLIHLPRVQDDPRTSEDAGDDPVPPATE